MCPRWCPQYENRLQTEAAERLRRRTSRPIASRPRGWPLGLREWLNVTITAPATGTSISGTTPRERAAATPPGLSAGHRDAQPAASRHHRGGRVLPGPGPAAWLKVWSSLPMTAYPTDDIAAEEIEHGFREAVTAAKLYPANATNPAAGVTDLARLADADHHGVDRHAPVDSRGDRWGCGRVRP